MTEVKKVKRETSDNNEISDKPTNQAKIALALLGGTLIISILLAAFSGTLVNWGDKGGSNVFIRVSLGLALGYILVRSYFGFAGSVNRAMRGNSLKLMRAIMFAFGITSILIGVMYMANMTNIIGSPETHWWDNAISPGLAIGAILFGFGMALASACASGGLTDGAWNPTKMFIVVGSFGLGVFIGFPFQNGADWIGGTGDGTLYNFLNTGKKFNFNSDIIKNNHVTGALVGISITIALCLVVIGITKLFDFILKTKEVNSFDEADFSKEWTRKELKETHKSVYAKMVERPFTLIEGAIAMSVVFVVMVLLTHDAWGVSTPYGLWVGQILSTLHITSPEQLATYTGMSPMAFSMPLTSNAVGMQNIGIFIGGTIAALSMNKYSPTFRISLKEGILWTIGGIIMGIGTRLSNGCNVGSLYSPIAFGSASGWVFFIFMVVGAIGGNILFKKVK